MDPLTALPDHILVDVAKYLYGHRPSAQVEILHFSRINRRIRAILRDPVNVCQILSEPYVLRQCVWHSNLFVRLSSGNGPEWLTNPAFLDYMIEYVTRHDERTPATDRKIGAAWSLRKLLDALMHYPAEMHYPASTRPQQPLTKGYAVAAYQAAARLLDRFWSNQLLHCPARLFLETQQDALQSKTSGVPLAHCPCWDRKQTWVVYGRCKQARTTDILHLILLSVGSWSIHTVREELEQCPLYGSTELLQTITRYRYHHRPKHTILKYLVRLFPES